MIKALIVGTLISLCASLIGVSTVLRRNSMIGDGLSHVAFMTFAMATVLNFSPLYFSIPIVILVSFLILRLNSNNKVHGDSIIALASASSLAIGTFLVSIKGVNIDINNYLFGSILGVDYTDVIVSIILTIIVLFLYLFFYNKIFAITFDETFSKSIGIKTNVYNALFAVLCSLVVVVGMRLMGSLLISSLIIFPALSSMQLFKKFKSVVISSIIISIISFIIGLILSFIFSTPTGATVVIVNLIVFIVFKIISMIK
jgi:zinc transport system permease protein